MCKIQYQTWQPSQNLYKHLKHSHFKLLSQNNPSFSTLLSNISLYLKIPCSAIKDSAISIHLKSLKYCQLAWTTNFWYRKKHCKEIKYLILFCKNCSKESKRNQLMPPFWATAADCSFHWSRRLHKYFTLNKDLRIP